MIRFVRIAAVAALIGGAPVARAQTASPLLLVLNKDDATLSFISAADGKTIARVPTGEAPHEVAACGDGKLAFVTNYGTGPNPGTTISVIDVAARKEIRRLQLGALQRPHGVACVSGKAYFTAEANRVLARYDPESNQIDWILGTGQATTHMVLANADGSRLFTANIGSDTVSVLERTASPAAWNVTQVPVGKGPEAIDMSPDGKQVWVAGSRDGSVSIIDVAQKTVVGTIDAGTRRANRLKFTRDGQRVLITDLDAGELVAIDVPARKVIKRMRLGRSVEGILVVPDGSRVYVAVTAEDHLAVLDPKTLEVVGKVETGKGPDGMAYVGR